MGSEGLQVYPRSQKDLQVLYIDRRPFRSSKKPKNLLGFLQVRRSFISSTGHESLSGIYRNRKPSRCCSVSGGISGQRDLPVGLSGFLQVQKVFGVFYRVFRVLWARKSFGSPTGQKAFRSLQSYKWLKGFSGRL